MVHILKNPIPYIYMKYLLLFLSILSLGCQLQNSKTSINQDFSLTSEFKTYWFDGTAEISSFKLNQSRYGEDRSGEAVLIFVTEDFLTDTQVKANQKSEKSKIALKLNRTKNFITGVYPYSIMNSSFTYLDQKDPLAKISTSIQEWCGQAYLQLNKKNTLHIKSHSYFEGEADQNIHLKNGLTEDELWHWIRINPELLPLGALEVLPAFEYLRLLHKPLKFYEAKAVLETYETHLSYQLSYPELNRKLRIDFEKTSPYRIKGWQEIDLKNPANSTSATIIKTLKLPYWQLNHRGDERYRDSLELN